MSTSLIPSLNCRSVSAAASVMCVLDRLICRRHGCRKSAGRPASVMRVPRRSSSSSSGNRGRFHSPASSTAVPAEIEAPELFQRCQSGKGAASQARASQRQVLQVHQGAQMDHARVVQECSAHIEHCQVLERRERLKPAPVRLVLHNAMSWRAWLPRQRRKPGIRDARPGHRPAARARAGAVRFHSPGSSTAVSDRSKYWRCASGARAASVLPVMAVRDTARLVRWVSAPRCAMPASSSGVSRT